MTQPVVFISYSHKDEKEKDRLLSHLGVVQRAGLIELWSDDRIGAGADWEAEITWAIAQARVAILLISANFLTSDFILGKEVPMLFQRRQREGLIIFPVIATACAWRTVDWLTKMNVRPKNGRPVWSESGSHVDEDFAAIAEEVALIVNEEMSALEASTHPTTPSAGHRETQEASKPPCPYPGMVPFSAKDARFFYGRDDEIWKMLQHLRHQRYLFVIGPSGSGKSSLVFAGLLPKLQKSGYFPQGFWLVQEMRPSSQPWLTLAQVVGEDLAQPGQALASKLAAHPPSQRLLLVIDQFEELFTQAARAERNHFISTLQILRRAESCALLIIMRADFYPDLMNSDLWPVNPSQRLEIAPLRREVLRKAIQQPATDAGIHLEAGLVERLLADAADEPGVLPLVQETMVLLWEEMQDHLLPLRVYERLGGEGRSGLAVAMATKADATLAELSPAQQAIARRIFLRLVQFGEGRADTRRQQPVTALSATGDDPFLFGQTLRHLTDNRLLTLSGEEGGGARQVDISHEALISGWPILQRWLSERREAERTRRRLEAKVAEWRHLGRKSGGLLDEVELLEAERWLASSDAADLGYDENLPALVRASRVAIEETEQEKEAARQALERRVQALSALNEMGQTLTSGIRLQEDEILELIYEQTRRLTDAWEMYIALYDEEKGMIRFGPVLEKGQRVAINPRQADMQRREKTEEVIFTKRPLLHRTEQEVEDWYRLPGHQEFRGGVAPSWMGVPMIVGEKVLGVIAVYDWEREHVYDEQDLQVLASMASQAAIALDNASLYYKINQALERRVEALSVLNEVGQTLTAGIRLKEDEILNLIYEQARRLSGTQNIYIALYEEETDTITFRLVMERGRRVEAEQQKGFAPRKLDKAKRGKTEEVILTRKPILHKTRAEVVAWYSEPGHRQYRGEVSASHLAVPMVIAERVIGVIAIYDWEQEYAYDEQDLQVLSSMASQAAIALDNANLYAAAREELIAARQLAALGTVTAAIQHRINNTLNIIVPNITRLRKRVDTSDETVQEILGIIERNTKYTSDYITRIQEPLKETDVQSIDINISLREAQDYVLWRYQNRTWTKKVEVIYNLDDSLPLIEASSGQVAEIFRNLIENSYKAMGADGGTLTIVSRRVDDRLEVEIQDTGPGIPPNIRDKLFIKPVPSRKPGEGSGLGLWLTNLLLQKYGGEISIEKTGADGTTMLVSLPVSGP